MIDFGVAASVVPGESECGDRYAVKEYGDRVLVAAVDGLGHGPDAAAAALKAITAVNAVSSCDLVTLVQYCHERLKASRGVVMTLADIDVRNKTMRWLGVGNVEGILIRARKRAGLRERGFVLQRGGIVGHHLPVLQPISTPILPGDTLILATDGISRDFISLKVGTLGAQDVADTILRQFGIGTDDALVVVVRYMEEDHG